MSSLTPLQILLLFSILAGAVHVLAPDHWLPSSVLTWQRQWGFLKTLLFSSLVFLIHLSLGGLIYFFFFSFFSQVKAEFLFPFTLLLLFFSLCMRLARFSRIQEVLRSGANSRWGYFATLSLLGPCESLIPLLIKSKLMGTGYLLPFLAFFMGTLLTGGVLVYLGRILWNHPVLFSKSLSWAYQRTTAVPLVLLLFAGLSTLFRMV